MGKLGSIGDRIAAKKAAHEKKADEWAAKLDAIDAREPEAFAIGDAVIAERDADIRGFEDDMRKLSNLPLLSGQSLDASKPPTEPKDSLKPPEAPPLPKAPQLAPAATPSPAPAVAAKAPFPAR